MTIYTKRLIIIVDGRDRTAARTGASLVDKRRSAGQFNSGCSADGLAPATHYIANWQMDTSQDSALRSQLATLVSSGRVWIYDAASFTPAQVLRDRGLQLVRPA